MIAFPYHNFADEPDFPVHLQYGYHNEDLYVHTHADFSELVIVLDGSAEHLVNGERYPIAKGDVFVVSESTAHGFSHTENLVICNLMFQPEKVFSACFDLKQLAGFQALFVLEPHCAQNSRFCSQLKLAGEEFAAVEQTITEAMQEYRQKSAGWRDFVYTNYHRLCLLLARDYERGHLQSRSTYLKLADVVAYIEHHCDSALLLPQLAQIAGYSERQLLRLFHETFATTPRKYIIDLRIRRAKHLLSTSNLSVGEIAWKCGFDDQNYFARCFKRNTGLTPTAYQTLIRG